MRPSTLLLVFALLAPAARAATAQPLGREWKVYTDSAGRYAVRMPGTPRVVDRDEFGEPIVGPRGQVQLDMPNGAMYTVAYRDVAGESPADALAAAKAAASKAFERIDLARDVTHTERGTRHPGFELRGVSRGRRTFVRCYVVHQRVFALAADGPSGAVFETEAFFKSLRVLAPAAP